MDKKGAIDLLKYSQELQESKIRRLGRQIDETNKVRDALFNEIGRREKEED